MWLCCNTYPTYPQDLSLALPHLPPSAPISRYVGKLLPTKPHTNMHNNPCPNTRPKKHAWAPKRLNAVGVSTSLPRPQMAPAMRRCDVVMGVSSSPRTRIHMRQPYTQQDKAKFLPPAVYDCKAPKLEEMMENDGTSILVATKLCCQH